MGKELSLILTNKTTAKTNKNMRKKILLALALLPMVACAQYRSEVWCPDNGDGTYTDGSVG